MHNNKMGGTNLDNPMVFWTMKLSDGALNGDWFKNYFLKFNALIWKIFPDKIWSSFHFWELA